MTENTQELKIIIEYVRENEEKLKRKYGRNYIAVHPLGLVVGFGPNKNDLTKMCRSKFMKYIGIGTIDEILNPQTAQMNSPEVAR